MKRFLIFMPAYVYHFMCRLQETTEGQLMGKKEVSSEIGWKKNRIHVI